METEGSGYWLGNLEGTLHEEIPRWQKEEDELGCKTGGKKA